ncbi:MAG: hydrolase [Phycisphaerales bacterium]|nr:MAG: hydrolase [Phycisphaerales bacterium]
MILRANQLDVDRAFVLVIDLQEKLVPLVRHRERVIAAGRRLLEGTRVFKLPVLATEQYPKGLGRTHETIRNGLELSQATILEKPTFSAWAEAAVREAILGIDRPQVIMVGVEAHVCIQQTTLDLISRDYDVFVCADGVSSRSRFDCERSLERMRQEGAFVTSVESVLFELCHRCDTPEFKGMLEVVKETPPADD